MERTRILLDRQFTLGPVDQRLFGGFLEHVGRSIYQGVFEPGSPHADANGFRTDVLASLNDLHFSVMRYPGGNFASGYHWMDGIGPAAFRPVNFDLAAKSLEPNTFGTDEFMRLAQQVGWQPMLTVNLGTGSPEEACHWLEYCNLPAGSKYSDLRVKNGFSQPYGVKLWCLGNEMDGPWQLGHVPADQYAIRAHQAAKMMKYVDPAVQLVVCGSSETGLPTYAEWDRQVLEYLGNDVDFLGLHQYVGKRESDTADYLAVTNAIDRHIEDIDAVCRYVQARRKEKKRLYLAFDEWNVWYRTQNDESVDGHGSFAPHLVEEQYDLQDALVVAGFLNSFIRHADVVKIANLAQVVNVIAPILTRRNDLLRQSIYYSLLLYASRRAGDALIPVVKGPGYESPSYGYVHTIDSAAILGERALHVFLVNRSESEKAEVEIVPAGIPLKSVLNAEMVTGPSADSRNTFEAPGTVRQAPLDSVRLEDGRAEVLLPPLCAAAITFEWQ